MDKLREAFVKKERAEIYLLNLEKLKADNPIKEDFYNSLKSRYTRARGEAVEKIDQLKIELKKKIEEKNHELALASLNLKYIEAKHEVGQLAETEFTRQIRDPKKKVEALEKTLKDLKQLVEATVSSDIPTASFLKKLNLNMLQKKEEAITNVNEIPPQKPLEIPVPPETGQPEIIPGTTSLLVLPTVKESPAPLNETQEEVHVAPKRHLPPELTITSLHILPDRVVSGNDVGVVASVKNIGDQEINYKVELRINEDIKDFQNISVMPGESEEITFLIPTGPPGEYQIDIDGQSGKYKVLLG